MTYRILLFTDSKWRDLPGNTLLKYRLQELDDRIHVQLCPFHLWDEAIQLYSPHLVLLTHIQGKRNRKIASYVKRHGGNVAVMFSEGIVLFDEREKAFVSQKDAKHVDLFICWNDIVADLVGGESFGCPRFDFYGDELKGLIDSRGLFCDKYGLDPNRKIVLLGDSWPGAKFAYSMQAFLKADWADLDNDLLTKWANSSDYADSQQSELNKFKLFASLLRTLYPAVQVVIKSHPMSDFLMWANWCNEAGITLVHGDYSHNAINAADLYITKLGSITVAEAWLLGTKAIKMGQEYESASAVEQLDADEYNLESLRDAVEIIDAAFENDDGFILNDKHTGFLDKWGLSTSNASSKIAHRLVDFIDSAPAVPPNYADWGRVLYAHDYSVGEEALDSFGNWDKAVTQKDVRQWMGTIELLMGDYADG